MMDGEIDKENFVNMRLGVRAKKQMDERMERWVVGSMDA